MTANDLYQSSVLCISEPNTAVVYGHLQTKRAKLLQSFQCVILNPLQLIILRRVIHFLRQSYDWEDANWLQIGMI